MKKLSRALWPSCQIRMVRHSVFETSYLTVSCLKSVVISDYAIVITLIFLPTNSPEKWDDKNILTQKDIVAVWNVHCMVSRTIQILDTDLLVLLVCSQFQEFFLRLHIYTAFPALIFLLSEFKYYQSHLEFKYTAPSKSHLLFVLA